MHCENKLEESLSSTNGQQSIEHDEADEGQP